MFYSRSVCFGAPILTHNTALPASLSSHCTSQTTDEHLFYPITTLTVHNSPENNNYQYKNVPRHIFHSRSVCFDALVLRLGLRMRSSYLWTYFPLNLFSTTPSL